MPTAVFRANKAAAFAKISRSWRKVPLLGRPYRNYRAGVLRLKGAKIGPVVFKSPLSSIVFKDLVFQLGYRHYRTAIW